jgi:hypothetical protein
MGELLDLAAIQALYEDALRTCPDMECFERINEEFESRDRWGLLTVPDWFFDRMRNGAIVDKCEEAGEPGPKALPPKEPGA